MPNTITIRKPVFVLIHFRERFQKYTDSMKTISVLVWTEGLTVSINHGSNVDHNALRSWHAAMYKFVTSMVLCGLGMQQCTMRQKTTFFELGVYFTVEHCAEKHYK